MEVLHDAVEHAVDVRGAFGRAVHLGDVEIFVERDAQGNGGEGEYLGEGDLHDDDIHHGEAIELPVARVVADITAQLGVTRKRGVEEVLRKAAVVIGTEFWQQAMGVIMGANIGTTITGWLVSSVEWAEFLSPQTLAPVAIMIGVIVMMTAFIF